MKNRIFAIFIGAALALSAGVIAQISGGGVEGGGRIPGGSAFATQYKSGNNFAGTGPGTSGQVLTSNGASAAPTYQTVSAGTPAGSVGAIQYNNSGSFGGTGPGTAGQLLMSNGAGVNPSFTNTISGSKTLTGIISFQNDATFLAAMALRQQTPSTLSTTNNNYSFGGSGGGAGASVYRLEAASGGSTITGMTVTATEFYIIRIFNVSSTDSIVFKNESASSTAGNRILTPNAADFTLQPQAGATFWYDATGTSRWRILNITGGSVSYPLLAPNGSSGAPSYSFSGQTTTGLWYDNGNSRVELRSGTGVHLFSNAGTYTIGTSGGAPLLGSATAYVTNNGSCSVVRSNGVGSVSHPGTGTCDILFTATFANTPICTATQEASIPTATVSISNTSTGGVSVNAADYLTGLGVDADFTLICQGT